MVRRTKKPAPTPTKPTPPRASKARSVVAVPPDPKAFGDARAILRAATAYVDAMRPVYWGTSRWPAVEEARRAVGRACFCAVGEIVKYAAPETPTELLPTIEPGAVKVRAAGPATGLLKRWWALEGNANGAAARDTVRAGQTAFFALRDALGVGVVQRRVRPLDVWFASVNPEYAPRQPVSADDDHAQRALVLAERRAALAGATSKKALALVGALVGDDQWDADILAQLRAAQKTTADWLAGRLQKRIERAKTERALRAAWAAAKKAGRAAELDEHLRGAVTRIGLSDAQASRLAA